MEDFNLIAKIIEALSIIIPLLLALCVHEYAHGWMALKKGDTTAKMMGRLTLNPVPHIDPIGTLALPFAMVMMGAGGLFGWAKPVPVNPRNLSQPREDMFWIAIAGPASNIIQAFIALVVLYLAYITLYQFAFSIQFYKFLGFYIRINFILAAFNMLPIHPLDGGKVLARFLPPDANHFLEQNQHMLYMVLIALIFILPSMGLPGLGLILGPVDGLAHLLMGMVRELALVTIAG